MTTPSMTAKYPRDKALAVAEHLRNLLAPVTEPNHLAIVGSLRRGRTFVSDVELLFVPRTEIRPLDMFQSAQHDLAAERIENLVAEGILAKRPNIRGIFAWGAQNKLAVHEASGIPVDLFATTVPKWYVSLVVRTGPKELNQRISEKAHELGLDFHAYGEGFTVQKTNEEIACQSEEAVFKTVHIPFLPPEQRDQLIPQWARNTGCPSCRKNIHLPNRPTTRKTKSCGKLDQSTEVSFIS